MAAPALHQQVVLKGTSARWSNHRYSATVVDLRSADGTIKVQYADGGFKRFTSSEFQASLAADHPPGAPTDDSSRSVTVGDRLFVKGTGRWEGKGRYRAEIMECRASDDSVKVRFLDGAMKRWPRHQFMMLVRHFVVFLDFFNRIWSLPIGNGEFVLIPIENPPEMKTK